MKTLNFFIVFLFSSCLVFSLGVILFFPLAISQVLALSYLCAICALSLYINHSNNNLK